MGCLKVEMKVWKKREIRWHVVHSLKMTPATRATFEQPEVMAVFKRYLIESLNIEKTILEHSL